MHTRKYYSTIIKKGTSLVAQWLRLHVPNAGGVGSIPGRGAKIPCASGPKNQNIKQKQYCNKFNKDFKNGPYQKNLEKKKRITNLAYKEAMSRRSSQQPTYWGWGGHGERDQGERYRRYLICFTSFEEKNTTLIHKCKNIHMLQVPIFQGNETMYKKKRL